MKIRVPVVYDENVIPKRASKMREESFGEWLEVEVREVPEMEAPVALRWEEGFRDGIDGWCERRWHDGRFWEPAIYSESQKPNEHVNLEDLLERTASGYTYGNPLVNGLDWRIRAFAEGRDGKPLDRNEYRVIETNNRETELRRAEERAAGVIVIDGLVWVAAPEPVYQLKYNGSFSGSWVSVDIIEANSVTYPKHVFRADRFDDMSAYALEKWNMKIDEEYRIHVFMPETLRHDDEMPALLYSLRDAVSDCRRGIAEKDRVTVIAWLDLRDAVDGLGDHPSEDALSNALAAADVWMTVSDGFPDNIQKLQAALNRWNARPILFDVDAGSRQELR